MFRGEYSVTLDDMGRIMLPRRLRDMLDNDVVLRKCEDGSIWLFTVEEWDKVENDVVKTTNIFSAQDLAIRRRYVATPVEIDKQGRILIPPTFRDHADLSKDCLIRGQFNFIEIWDEKKYKWYEKSSVAEYRAASEKISARLNNIRDLGNGTDSSFSGTAGTGAGVSGPEGQA